MCAMGCGYSSSKVRQFLVFWLISMWEKPSSRSGLQDGNLDKWRRKTGVLVVLMGGLLRQVVQLASFAFDPRRGPARTGASHVCYQNHQMGRVLHPDVPILRPSHASLDTVVPLPKWRDGVEGNESG